MVKEYKGEDFKELVKEGITFIDFFALWCNPCMMMMPIIDSISEEVKEVNFIKVNVDDYQELAIEFRINSIPRFMIFKNGEIVKQFVGVQQKSTIIEALLNA